MKIKLSLWGCLPGLSFNILSTKKRCFIAGLNAAKPVLGVSDKARLKPVYSARETI